MTLADHYRETSAVARAFELAWAHTQVEHRHPELVGAGRPPLPEARLAHPLRQPHPQGRAADPGREPQGPAGLWPYGISGDKPIVLAFVADFDEVALAVQLLVRPHLTSGSRGSTSTS